MRLTEKGQVTVPKPIRDRMGIGPGSEVEFVEEDGLVRLVRLDDIERHRRSIDAWLENVRGSGNGTMSVEDIMDATRGP